MLSPPIIRRPLPARTPEQAAADRAAYIAAFNARTPAEIELDLLEHKDGRWTDADRARAAELRRGVAAGG